MVHLLFVDLTANSGYCRRLLTPLVFKSCPTADHDWRKAGGGDFNDDGTKVLNIFDKILSWTQQQIILLEKLFLGFQLKKFRRWKLGPLRGTLMLLMLMLF